MDFKQPITMTYSCSPGSVNKVSRMSYNLGATSKPPVTRDRWNITFINEHGKMTMVWKYCFVTLSDNYTSVNRLTEYAEQTLGLYQPDRSFEFIQNSIVTAWKHYLGMMKEIRD